MSWQLSKQTWQHLADRPRERELVTTVCDRLDHFDHTATGGTRDNGARDLVAALRFVLAHHQPTTRGRCRACRRATARRLWRRRPWPCAVWMQVHYELIGPFTGCGHHRHS